MHIRVVHGARPVPSIIPTTTIVVVTWNAMATLPACLEQLRRHTPTPHRLTIVDNASRDDTPTYLRTLQETQPHLRVIRNKKDPDEGSLPVTAAVVAMCDVGGVAAIRRAS